MWKKLTSHSTSYLHRSSVANLKESYLKSLQTCCSENKVESDVTVHASTVNIIRTVYAEVKLNIAIESHANIIVLQKMNGANMGGSSL